jgi:hypothetical protein
MKKEQYLNLMQYVQHDDNCEISQTYPTAGRPTANGGYEQRILGKWYQISPVDKRPKFKCTCGLDDLLNKLKK